MSFDNDDLSPDLRERFARCKAELADLGIVLRGSVTERWTPCGKPGCRCQADPPQLHGPYFQWTTKIAGKTKTVRLRPEEVEDYEAWISAGKRLEQALREWRELSIEAVEEIREKTRR